MNIILGSQLTDELRQKYILLELDSFRTEIHGEPVTAYCVLDQLDLGEMMVMQQYLDLHANLMPNYRKQNWNYVEQAIEHLMGRWGKQLDTFYTDILGRVAECKKRVLDDAWDGVLYRQQIPRDNT